jgi:hypothetical protein
MALTASYTAPWTMAKLRIAECGGCLATVTIADVALMFHSRTTADDSSAVAKLA